jgi:lipopolysaccharide export system permease protein
MIMLEDGSQQFQSQDKKLSVLYFDKYLLDINQNQSDNWATRWKSPSERTIEELKNPNPDSLDDQNNLQAFKAELSLRYSMPLNIIGFSSLVAIVLLSFSYKRTENLNRTIIIFITIILLQVVSIITSNLSIKYQDMQIFNFIPTVLCLFLIPALINKSKKI